LKDLGNKAFAAKDYDKAIDLFSQAIAVDPNNHVLWSNRSAAKAGKKDWSGALADADEVHFFIYLIVIHIPTEHVQCIKLNPAWGKGWARKGAALHGARKYDEAITAYNTGLALEDSPALRKGLQEVQDARGSISVDQLALCTDKLLSKSLIKDPLVSGKYLPTPISSVNWRPIHEPRNIWLIPPSYKRYETNIIAIAQDFHTSCSSNCIKKILNLLTSMCKVWWS
jgi:stress-induced-phosphoprotein 1